MKNQRLKIKLANELITLKCSLQELKEKNYQIPIPDLSLLIRDLDYLVSMIDALIETDIEENRDYLVKFILPFINRLEAANTSLSNIMKFIILNKTTKYIKFNYTLISIKGSINTLEHEMYEFSIEVLKQNT